MIKNTAGQKVGVQMVSATDGSAFTGTVTVYVTVDAGTQALGSVGSGVCTHEGNGFHTYAPAQAETNGDHLAFTYIGTGAVPVTVQVYPVAGDAYTRLGAPAGASVSADLADIESKVDDLETRVSATRAGYLDNLSAGAVALEATAQSILTDTAEIGAAGAGLTEAGGTGDHLTAVPWNAAWDAEVQSEAEDALVAHRLDELMNADSDIDGAAPPTVGSVVHELLSKTAGSFTYDQTTDSLEAVRDRGDAAWITATGFSTLDAAGVRSAMGLAAANLDTQLAALPTAAENADAVWDETRAGHVAAGSFGEGVASVQGNVTGSVASVTGAVGSVTGAVGSVTGAVGSVTGNVGGNVVGSVGSVTGNVGGSVASVVGNVGGNVVGSVDSVVGPVTVGTNNDKTGYAIGTGGIAAAAFAAGAIDASALNANAVDEILDEQIGDSTITMRQALKVMVASLAGKLSGALTTSISIRNVADDTNVIVATVDGDGNRSAVTLTV